MSDFGKYMYHQAKKDAAWEAFNAASARLELAQIRCRLAEIDSQNEPIASLLDKKMSERERLYAMAHFVVVGRMPE